MNLLDEHLAALFSHQIRLSSLKRMSRNSVNSSRILLVCGMLLVIIVGFASISATVVRVSFAAVILVLVAIAEAGIIILGLIKVQRLQETPVERPTDA